MKLEVGKTYETRGGQTVRILCLDKKGGDFPVVGLLTTDDREIEEQYLPDGSYYKTGNTSIYDLVREHTPVTYRWVNIYEGFMGGHCESFSKAVDQAGDNLKGRIKLAFDPSGNLLVDKCEITAAEKSS